jgi:hypothetical protein
MLRPLVVGQERQLQRNLDKEQTMKFNFDQLAVTLALLALVTAGCATPEIGLVPRVGSLDIDGDFGTSAGSGAFVSKSSASALGLDEETAFQPRVDLDWTDWHMSVNATQVEFSGDGTVQRTLNLPGQQFTAGTPVSTEWDFGLYTASLVYDLIPAEDIDIGFGAGVGLLDYDISAQSRTTSAKASTDDNLPFAYLTARVAREIGRFAFLAQVSGAGIDWDDEDISFFELDLSAAYRLFSTKKIEGSVMAGYRMISVDYEWEDGGSKVEADADFDGPYVGFILRF